MTRLTNKQVEHLLAPINPRRVLGLKKGNATLSYVAQHDVRAHLTRIFGFGNWSTDVLETEFMHEEQNEQTKRWVACYRATVKVTICAPDGTEIAHYTDCHASGNMPNPERAEAHALALTTAVSTAMKRAATCLGDQFGLSLYNKGQRTAFVISTLVGTDTEDVEVAEVKALGDEDDQDIAGKPQEAPEAPVAPTPEEAAIEALGDAVADPGQTLADLWLADLRSHATEQDASKRILAVAALKQKAAGTDILDQVTQVAGADVTYARLADLVAAGEWAK